VGVVHGRNKEIGLASRYDIELIQGSTSRFPKVFKLVPE
jgi:hypothetical protein